MKGSFEQVHVQVYIHLQPRWVKKIKEGVNNILGKKLLKYSDEFEGVPVAFTDVKLLDRVGIIKDEAPDFHFLVRYRCISWMMYVNVVSAVFTVFAPKVGDMLEAVVNKIGMDHIGLLVHGLFNASIPRHNVPYAAVDTFLPCQSGTPLFRGKHKLE